MKRSINPHTVRSLINPITRDKSRKCLITPFRTYRSNGVLLRVVFTGEGAQGMDMGFCVAMNGKIRIYQTLPNMGHFLASLRMEKYLNNLQANPTPII